MHIVRWEDIFKYIYIYIYIYILFTWATGLEFTLLCCEDAKKEIRMKRQKVN